MLRIIYFILTITLIACSNGHIKRKKTNPVNIYEKTVNGLFENGKYEVNFTIREDYNEKRKKILRKISKSYPVNKDWFDNVIQNFKKGDTLQYDRHMGITRTEFDTLFSSSPDTLPLSEKGKLSVIKSENEIHFKGFGKLSVLDSLVIKLTDSVAIFGQNHLSLMADNKLSKKYIPEKEYLESVLAYNANNIIELMIPNPPYYVLYIAKLGKSGKTFMFFTKNEYKEDLRQDTQITVVFD